eukprot:GCRY01000908.1.p1 GENE.GCRY01000908.1~~GCRY01000908.1.p1  ORF type:complete len:209 (-),score=28.11 GCRY01000908.1:188-814(-)
MDSFVSDVRSNNIPDLYELNKLIRKRLKNRGASGIRGLARAFRIIDDNRDKQLNKEEFSEALNDVGILVNRQQLDALMIHYDKDNSGTISFDEFLLGLRGDLNERRLGIVKQAFEKLDRDGSGVVTVDDIRGIYNVSRHPKYISGEKTEDDILKGFLNNFEGNYGDGNGEVTWEEFRNYYSGLSASFDYDDGFVEMMENCWNIEEEFE